MSEYDLRQPSAYGLQPDPGETTTNPLTPSEWAALYDKFLELAAQKRALEDRVTELEAQLQATNAPVIGKVPVGVVTVCIPDYPDQSVTECFKTRSGDWVVIVDSGESLRFDDDGYFPPLERGREIKSILIFAIHYELNGIKSVEYECKGVRYGGDPGAALLSALLAARGMPAEGGKDDGR